MNKNKQKLIIEYLLSSEDIFATCIDLIIPEYFDPKFRKTVEFIKEYYNKYNNIPTTELVFAEIGLEFEKKTITTDLLEYTTETIERFARERAVTNAVLSAGPLIDSENYGELVNRMTKAVNISLERDLGINYFENPDERILELSKTSERLSTGWKSVDKYLNGGLLKTEMVLFSANSGGGKSITLSNLVLNLVAQKQHVLYVSLELSEKLIAQRFDTMITGIPVIAAGRLHKEMAQIIEKEYKEKNAGSLTIKRLPNKVSAMGIRAYLKEYELKNGFVPDALILDYIDLMGTNGKNDYSNVAEKDKLISEELYELGVMYNMYILTASQQNRCLDVNTLVKTDRSDKVKIKDLKIGDKVFNGISYNTVLEVLPITKQETYRIKLRSGKTIICSGNHKFPVDSKLKTINSGLKVGDKVLTHSPI